MEIFSFFGTTIEYDDVVNTLKERDYVGSGGRYYREYSIYVDRNTDIDHYNEIWQLPENIICQFKAQHGRLRTATIDLTDKLVYPPKQPQSPVETVDEVVMVKEAANEPTVKQKALNIGVKQTPAKKPKVRQPVKEETGKATNFHCSEIRQPNDITHKLLVHQIHVAGEVKGDPAHQKFTERAGMFHYKYSCPQFFLYLRNHHKQGRKIFNTCYAKAWPYSVAKWVPELHHIPRLFEETSFDGREKETGRFIEVEKGVYRADFERDKEQEWVRLPSGIWSIKPTLLNITIDMRH